MANIKDLEFIFDETQKKYPENSFISIISKAFANESYLDKITKNNNARKRLEEISINEIIKILAEEIVKINNYITLINFRYPNYPLFPYFNQIRRFIEIFKRENINSISYLQLNINELMEVLGIVDFYRFSIDKKYRKLIDNCKDNYDLPDVCEENLDEKIENDYKKVNGIHNVKVNNKAINKCIEDITNGHQIKNHHNEYALDGNLYATQDVGLKRSSQQDSVLIMTHPRLKDFKLLVVSDGIGGGASGEIVSNYIVKTISSWFQNINPYYYYFPKELHEAFNYMIGQINIEINKRFNSQGFKSGATFTGAIVTKNDTLISQIGDSRAYIIKKGLFKTNVNLVTYDESVVWPLSQNYYPLNPSAISKKELDNLRFKRKSNAITRYIGDGNKYYIQSHVIPNTSYDKLLLMSDGVSDLLSLEGIKIISKKGKWSEITNLLVSSALLKKSTRNSNDKEFYKKLVSGKLSMNDLKYYNNLKGIGNSEYVKEIPAGKDNASVVGYFRR